MLTVLFATRNRAHILRDVLESYCHLQEPASGWKLVVIDNGSTDQTGRVIMTFANRLPLHSAFEPSLGKNRALNSGLEFAEGDLIVFTDDDVFPSPDWLIQLRATVDSRLTHSIFGGAVVPRWEVPPPRWIQWLDLRPVYALTDPSLEEGPIHSSLIFGPNMAIRSSVFQLGIRFDPSVGPRGSDYPMGSETELVSRLSRQGHQAWFVPGAVVEHFIRKSQLKKTWVMRRAIRFGRGQYRLLFAEEVTSRKLLMGTPRYLFREIYQEGLRMTKAWASGRQEDFVRARWRFNFLLGKVKEARIMVRERSRHARSVQSNV